MNRVFNFLLIVCFCCLPLTVCAENPAEAKVSTLHELMQHFADPPAAYRPAPLYTWNGDMEEEEISRQLDEFKEGGFGGVFVHPRPGLITPYLSKRWLELWRHTADEATKRDMVSYIYDENSYPSGFAGGHVPENIPGSGQISLHKQELTLEQLNALELQSDTLALYRMINKESGEFERIPIPTISKDQTIVGKSLNLKPGDYILYTESYPNTSPWYGGKTFVDLMRQDVSDEFFEVTFGAYDSALSDLYGKQVLACFTDEPQVAGCWSREFPQAFQEQWGYDILDHLPSIHSGVGNWRKVRHDYASTILSLFMNRFVKTYAKECEERGIAFTGHVWEHGWPYLDHNPDIMSFYRWQHWPGIDCLMNEYSEGSNAQFGNYRANKELDSIANQMGRERRLCEAFGAGGWDLRLEDVKRIGDHLYAGGVNVLNPHLSYYTIMGARKRDHPQSFSYHQPFWDAFHIPMDYFGRLSWALAGGKSNAPILIIEPTVTMWMYNWSSEQHPRLNQLGAEFQSFITELGAKQVAFDLGSEPVMAEIASIKDKRIAVGQCEYEVVVLPPGLECLESSTVEILKKFAANGGTIISYVGVPPYVDAESSDAVQTVKSDARDNWIEENLSASALIDRWGNGGVKIQADDPKEGRVYHFVRDFDDGKLLFLINTSLEESSTAEAQVKGVYAEHWNAVTGKVESISYKTDQEKTVAFDISLPPAGSALFAIYQHKPDHDVLNPKVFKQKTSPLQPAGDLTVTAQQPNVLVLDYTDLVLDEKKQEGLYFTDTQSAVYKEHGWDRNPWDRGVQFNDEIIQQDHFPQSKGFDVHYPFQIKGFETMPALEVVVERGNFYSISINGHPVSANDDEWRIDRAFHVYSIQPNWLQNGSNVISLQAKSFSLHMEVEPVYVYGHFNLESEKIGHVITPTSPLKLGEWNQQGFPFYSDAVAYEQTYNLSRNDESSHYVELQDWKGTAARVVVNDKKAGYILWQPYRLDISEYLQPGDNTIIVEVIGSLKNLLGPHHAGKQRGRAWPHMFMQHPDDGQPSGAEYDTIGYGLFEPFLVY